MDKNAAVVYPVHSHDIVSMFSCNYVTKYTRLFVPFCIIEFGEPGNEATKLGRLDRYNYSAGQESARHINCAEAFLRIIHFNIVHFITTHAKCAMQQYQYDVPSCKGTLHDTCILTSRIDEKGRQAPQL